MNWSLLDFFTDPVLRAPTIGSMLMCSAAGLVGVLVFLRRQSLVGEALSHAAYPGVILGVIILGVFGGAYPNDWQAQVSILIGAFITAWAGLWAIHYLEQRLRVKPDTALCFVLSVFIGIGITLASEVQYSYTDLYKQTLIYFYGQAATMTDVHIYVYGILTAIVALALTLFYKELKVLIFDREYASTLGIKTGFLDLIVYTLIVLAVIIGIRSTGVVLMSAMLIAPAVAARQYTNRLGMMFFLSSLFGLISGFLGNVISVLLSEKIALPTGPSIVMVSAAICLFSLFFAPERGIVSRLWRIAKFRFRCMCENVLKTLWRLGPHAEMPLQELQRYHFSSKFYLGLILRSLLNQGWVFQPREGYYSLTEAGSLWAERIIRLHRLWEVYLVQYVGVGAEKVHRNAEEMEHIITPELEEELDALLKNPLLDPHNQPIPPKQGSHI